MTYTDQLPGESDQLSRAEPNLNHSYTTYNYSGIFITPPSPTLSDTSTNLFKWQLPPIAIEPDGYYIIWADEQKQEGFNHANFRLFNFGEKITLSNSSGVILRSSSISYFGPIFMLSSSDSLLIQC